MEKVSLNIKNENFQKLICCRCDNYLSCPPICATSEGGSICGRCSSSTEFRQTALEALLEEATFPCRYSQSGCFGELKFGRGNVLVHEENCLFRNEMDKVESNESVRPSEGNADSTNQEKGLQQDNPDNVEEINNTSEKHTVVFHDAQITVETPAKVETTSVKSGTSVFNPFSRKESTSSSIVNVRPWNPSYIPNYNDSYSNMPREGNSHGTNNYDGNYRRWNSYNQPYWRRPNHNRRKNNVVVIKGHTLYITL